MTYKWSQIRSLERIIIHKKSKDVLKTLMYLINDYNFCSELLALDFEQPEN